MLFEHSAVTRWSFFEYQCLILALAGLMCVSMVIVEVAIDRFHVLPLLFPAMLSVRERRLYVHGVDFTDGPLGDKFREQAKMIVRMTVCVALNYIWQMCVLDTSQTMGTDFPAKQCANNYDCFASRLQFMTFLNQQHTPIDCSSVEEAFEKQVVVSCIRFITPTATGWLMHLGISYSISQLTFKSYEVLVFISSRSLRFRRFLGALMFLSLVALVASYFANLLVDFLSTWLGFVMALVVPLFLHTVRRSGSVLETARREEESQAQRIIGARMDAAFAELEAKFAFPTSENQKHASRTSAKQVEVPAKTGLQRVRNLFVHAPTNIVKRRSADELAEAECTPAKALGSNCSNHAATSGEIVGSLGKEGCDASVANELRVTQV